MSESRPPVPYGPPYPPHIYHAPPASGLATASLVLGILGALGGWCLFGIPCLMAIVFGHAALRETKSGRRSGHGQAVAGLVLGYICVLPMAFIAFWLGVWGIAATNS